MSQPIADYFKALQREPLDKAREMAYRPALKALLEAVGKEQLKGKVVAVNDPAHIDCGAPDFVVQHRDIPFGYAEAKDIDVSLSDFEKTDQCKRYNEALSNLITTDYLEFRHYVDGDWRQTCRIGHKTNRGLVADPAGLAQLASLLESFFAQTPPKIGKVSLLVKRMAHLAHLLRQGIEVALASDIRAQRQSRFTQQFATVQQVLLSDLDPVKFADMYAQTLAYGMFASRLEQPHGEFDRKKAVFNVPHTNPLLREVFDDFAGVKADERILWLLDDLALLLSHANLAEILDTWDQFKRGEDWVVHFYETFLKVYDPKQREQLAVYLTPQPVVRYIVRAIDEVLKRDFGLTEGLSDRRVIESGHMVQILDPACGTGSFLFGVVDYLIQQFDVQGRRGQWNSYVHDHLLPRLNAFELQMAPYTVAHIKLGRQLADSGYIFSGNERVNIFLTNTLEDPNYGQGKLYVDRSQLVVEAEESRKVKRDKPILVVLGNPPYSVHSANASEILVKANGNGNGKQKNVRTFIGQLVQDYFRVDGQPLGERNPKSLQDDYVKFLRWAQWRIDRTGSGVLAFITNNGYLDNPTFRGMRQSLMQTFDLIYVLDLHGNSKKKERVPEDVQAVQGMGPEDKNVFDIQQGVAICVMVKLPAGKGKQRGVFHADLWGPRESHKYPWLEQYGIDSTPWQELKPSSPAYLFVPQDIELRSEYEAFGAITSIMPVNSSCATSGRDQLVVGFTLEQLISGIEAAAGKAADTINQETATSIIAQTNWKDHSRVSLYRPFDRRSCILDPVAFDRPRLPLNYHLDNRNFSLVTTRQTKDPFAALATNLICSQHKIASVYDRSYFFPLYLYPLDSTDLKTDAPGGRRPNLAPVFITACEKVWKLSFVINGTGDLNATFGPEDVFHYMYAVLHSSEYRRRYAEFLKRDFPRLPLTSKKSLLKALCVLGSKLTRLHLMDASAVDTSKFKLPKYPIAPTSSAPQAKGLLAHGKQRDMNLHEGGGGDKVEKVRYEPPTLGKQVDEAHDGRVWINDFQYFEGVAPEVWEFGIGGYQPAERWLKDRGPHKDNPGRKLTYDDQEHYKLIIAIMAQTRALMAEIDAAIDKSGGWPLK